MIIEIKATVSLSLRGIVIIEGIMIIEINILTHFGLKGEMTREKDHIGDWYFE